MRPMEYRAHRSTQAISFKLIGLSISLGVLIGMAGCTTHQQQNNQTISSQENRQAESPLTNAEAATLFSEYDQFLLDSSPMFETSIGKKDRQYLWDDFSLEAKAKRIEKIKDFQKRAVKIELSQLSNQNRQSLQMLVALLESEIKEYEFRQYHYVFSHMFGVHSYLTTFLVNDHQVDSKEDANAYLTRIETIGTPIKAAITIAKHNQNAGITPPKFTYPLVLETLQGLLEGYPLTEFGEHPLYKDFKVKLSGLDLTNLEREALFERFIKAMNKRFKPAYRELYAFINHQQPRAARNLGVHQFKDGFNYYASQIRFHTTTTMTADEIHTFGLSEVNRIHQEIKGIMDEVGFKGSLQEFFTYTREAPQFKIGNSRESQANLLLWNQELLTNMKEQLPKTFNTIPDSGLEIKAVEKFREKSAGLAFYQRPGLYSKKPGIYYINLHKIQDNPNYILPALAYHEGLPGHHFQLALQKDQEAWPLFRRTQNFTAFTEGWALYAEQLAEDMGMYKTAYHRYGKQIMDLKRAIRLVVDTGLHQKGWSMARAVSYRIENSPASFEDSQSAIQRFLVLPGQALAYSIGKSKILALRAQAQTQLGTQFDLAQFHDEVLKYGTLPLSQLEQGVLKWLNEKESTLARSTL